MDTDYFSFVAADDGEKFTQQLSKEVSEKCSEGYSLTNIKYFRHTNDYNECWAFEAVIHFTKYRKYNDDQFCIELNEPFVDNDEAEV